ncbi:hypothetical protein HOC80_04380 [archaeon]|nr:hypothetical protein [archaeon]
MKKMNEYKINSLKKVPKKAISWMGIDTDKTHFVDLVDRSNELGLDYLAERLTPTSSVKELEFDHSIEKKSEVPLADAYVGVGICGRDLKFYAQHLDKRYLSQGHVFLYLHINYDDDEKMVLENQLQTKPWDKEMCERSGEPRNTQYESINEVPVEDRVEVLREQVRTYMREDKISDDELARFHPIVIRV